MRNVRAMVVGVFLSIALFIVGQPAMAKPVIVGQPAMAKPVITEVLVLYDVTTGQPDKLRIEGLDFGTDPIVEIGNFATPLTIAELRCLAPFQCLEAYLPEGIEAGDFQLSLTSPSISRSCDDGKPGVLRFNFTGDNCSATNNLQEGKAVCTDLGPLGAPVEIVLTKDGSKITVTPSTETVIIGDQVTFSTIDKKLKASLKFDVRQEGTTLQAVTIHTSCSKQLRVGDQFGSMLLTEYFPEGLGLDEIVGTYDLTIGAVGPKGDQGIQGPTGVTGATGDAGAQGVQGKLGPEGDTGAQGGQGKLGPKGVIGAQGGQGKLGDTGPQGVQGKIGPQGAQGNQGKLGPQGEQGKLGAQGDQGKLGAQGDQGAQGKIGPQGEQGKIGPPGPPGPQGDPMDGLYVSIDGDVGIGTTEPVSQLTIDDGGDVYGSPHISFQRGRARFGYDSSSGTNAVVQGSSGKGIEFNVNARTFGSGTAMFINTSGNVGIGIGTATPQAKLDVGGAIRIRGTDVAEQFPVTENVKPGMVLAIDPENPGKLRLARGAYNTRVAGIVSGANGLPSGVVLGNMPGMEGDPAIALSGRVWCLVDAESGGPVNPGDMLTTSDIPGHAMKVTDHARARGAILGKAMTKLERGRDLVLVLVSLQ